MIRSVAHGRNGAMTSTIADSTLLAVAACHDDREGTRLDKDAR